jgi:tetratricopeptide (TPR) repeat protein
LNSRNKTPLAGCFVISLIIAGYAASVLDSANAVYTKGNLKESILLYKKALSAGDNAVLCYFNCGNAYFQLDSLSRALAYYRQCIHLAPDFPKARLNLAVIYYMLGDLGRCIAATKQALRLDANNQKMLLVLAAAYEKSGSIPEAAAQYEYILSKYPEMTDVNLALGQLYRNLNDYETAIKWLSDYPPAGKNYPYVLLLISDIYDQAGDLSRSLFYLQKSFEMEKKKNTYFRIVQTQKRMGNDFVALETAMQGMEIFPDYPELAIEAGNIAFNRGLLEKAEFCYQKAYALGSPSAVVGIENVRIVRTQKAAATGE